MRDPRTYTWMDQAACRPHELWDVLTVVEQLETCRGCPVLDQCRQWTDTLRPRPVLVVQAGRIYDSKLHASGRRKHGPEPSEMCKRGHRLLGDNLVVGRTGKRSCRQCRIEREDQAKRAKSR